jgi:hypothetical protein
MTNFADALGFRSEKPDMSGLEVMEPEIPFRGAEDKQLLMQHAQDIFEAEQIVDGAANNAAA